MGPTYLSLFYKWLKPPTKLSTTKLEPATLLAPALPSTASLDQITKYNNWYPPIKRKVFIVDIIVLIIILCLIPYFLKWNPGKSLNNEIFKYTTM